MKKIIERKDGTVYELNLDGTIPYIASERMDLGYFLVQKDRILRFHCNEENLQALKGNGQLPDSYDVVCQDEDISEQQIKDGMHVDWSVYVTGDTAEYVYTEHYDKPSYFETFRWEKNKGLTYYCSYYKAGVYILSFEVDQ